MTTAVRCIHPRFRPVVEQLETRDAPGGVGPSAVEQLYLERLNDARANPAAYGASIGLDLSGVAPAPPYAFHPLLILAARNHSQDMNDRGYFEHNTPDGVTPSQQVAAVGFKAKQVLQSISAGTGFRSFSFGPGGQLIFSPGQYPPEDSLASLIIDAGIPGAGHRRHLLGMITRADRLIGIGFVSGSGPYENYYTIDSAEPKGKSSNSYFTGSVFRDANANQRYDLGEGLGGVTLTFQRNGRIVGTVTTWDAGGYTKGLAPGRYTVTAKGGALAAPVTQNVRLKKVNTRLNFVV